jgi:lipoic acid synthetase
MQRFEPKPPWLKVRAPGGDTYHHLKQTFRELDLHTVCEEARCPNVGECWREGTATVMLLGDVCTRGCRFCAVTTGDPRGAVDPREPEHVARAIARLELTYVVLTMVDRDDLLDGGAEHVARTVTRLRELRPDMLIEALVGDFQGRTSAIDEAARAAPDVFAHNVEVVRRLTRKMRDARSSYDQSLAVLRRAKERIALAGSGRTHLTKSSLMVGVGETDDEVLEALADLRGAGVDVVTIGQYLRPTPKHAPVERFVAPDAFAGYERAALELGFLYCASAPLVRSSYRAAEVFLRSVLAPREPHRLGADGAPAEASALVEGRLDTARAAAARAREELPGALEERALAASGVLVEASSLVRRPVDPAADRGEGAPGAKGGAPRTA